MMCFRCGSDNGPGARYCGQCNAVLPRMESPHDVPAASLVDMQEGTQYRVPQRSFPTEHMYNLTVHAAAYIHEEASGTPLLEAYQEVRKRIEAFEFNDLPGLLDRLHLEKSMAPDDDYYSEIIYLLSRGVSMFREGFERFDAFIESGDTDTLKEAVTRMQEANDNLALGKQLSLERASQRS
jgi:hypothetical protein